jgi:hypothetical protein
VIPIYRGNTYMMAKQIVLVSILIFGGCLSGCRSRKALSGAHPAEFVGKWQLLIRSSCDQYSLRSDTMVIRSDGTFDQAVATKDGHSISQNGQHWQYFPDKDRGDISLEKRLEFFTPEHFGNKTDEGHAVSEMLIVDHGGASPVIVLNPDSDCVYVKAE